MSPMTLRYSLGKLLVPLALGLALLAVGIWFMTTDLSRESLSYAFREQVRLPLSCLIIGGGMLLLAAFVPLTLLSLRPRPYLELTDSSLIANYLAKQVVIPWGAIRDVQSAYHPLAFVMERSITLYGHPQAVASGQIPEKVRLDMQMVSRNDYERTLATIRARVGLPMPS